MKSLYCVIAIRTSLFVIHGERIDAYR